MQESPHKPTTPAVSIIIPAYNVSRYIGEAIESVLQQDFTSYEIVIINDGSTDTPELERVLKPYQDRIVYLKQANGGIAVARNAGLRVARGEFIALLDADDVWLPSKLTHQFEFLRNNDYDMIYGDAVLFGETKWKEGTTFMDNAPSIGEVSLESLLDLRATIVVSTVIVRKDLLVRSGGFDESDRDIPEDFDAWLRLAQQGARIGYERKVVAKYRYRTDSASSKRIKLHDGALRVLSKTRKTMQLTSPELDALSRTEQRLTALVRLERGKTLIVNGDFDTAFALLSEERKGNRSWKIAMTLVALRTFPALLQRFLRKRHLPESPE